MKKYFFNILFSFVVALVAAVLVFLVGNDGASLKSAAVAGGVYSGISMAIAYNLGCMVNEDEGRFNGVRLLTMVLVGILGGILGGIMMGWY